MFFILSKVLAFFVRPIVWVLICLIGSRFFNKRPKLKVWLFRTGIILFIIFSNQVISNQVMNWWEPEAVPIATLPEYDVAVVFSGITRAGMPLKDRVYFNQGADRITHALQLYNEGKVKHIVVTGGLSFKQMNNTTSAERLRDFLVMAGVPPADITVEANAVNTYQNAVETAKILNQEFPHQKYLLITSAFHMKRSALCLKAQGITFDEFPADYRSETATYKIDDLIIPRAQAIERWELIIKEIVGIATYGIMGYL